MNLPSNLDTMTRQGLARPMAPEEEAWIARMLDDLDPSKPAPTAPPELPGQQAQLVPWARQELLTEGPGVPVNEPLSEQERFDAQYAAPGPATFPAPSYRPPAPDNVVPSPEEVVPGRIRLGRVPEDMRWFQKDVLDVFWRHFMDVGNKPAMEPHVFTKVAEALQGRIRDMQAKYANNPSPAVQRHLQSFQDYSRRIDQAVEREMQAQKQARLAQPKGTVEAEVETPAVVPQPEPPVPPTPAVAVATPPRTAPSLVTPIEDIGGPQRPTPPPVPRRAALDPREDFTQEASVLNRPPADVWNMLRDEYATSPSREDGRVALQKAGIPSQPGDRLVDIAYGALARGEDLFPPPVAQEVPLPPPPGPGMVRLYRGSSTKSIPLPPWLDADPKFQATKHATGRWWTDNLAIAKWYYDDAAPTAKIEYVDVPEAVAQQGRLRQQPPEIQRFSLDPDNEYFLPAPYAGRGAPLPASLIPATAQPPQPPTPVAPAPTVPKPVPEATIANSGTPYKSKQNADFALTHKKGISPEHHEVVERPGYGWFIVPKGSAVPKAVEPVAPTEKPSPTPEPPSLYTALTTWGAKVTDAFQLPANERKAQLTTLRQEGVAMRDAAMTSPELVPTFDPQFERFLGMIDAELGKPQSASPAVQTATAASTPLPTRESVLPDQPPPVPVETPAPPAPTAKVAPPSEEAQNAGFQALVREIRHQLFVGGKAIKDIRDLQRLAEAAYGSHRAEGAYDTRDMYDALEVAINQQVREIDFPINKPLDQAIGTAEVLHAFMEKTPTQTLRTAEQDQLQQFSTPLDYAYATAWVANLQPQDLVIEPSAGTGTIANFAAMALGPKNVIVNEIAPRRLEALRMQGYGQITKEDALFLNTILSTRLERHPSVVLMNPPFSIAASQGQHNPKVGANHVEQALRLLADGGRLVAIVGRGMGPETATFREWFDKIGKQHSIRAVIEVDGKVYQKQGTEFGTRIIVIDKGTPTAEGSILTGKVATIPDLLRMLDEVRNVRTITAVVPTPERPDTPETRPGDTPPGNQPTRPTDAVEPHAPKGRPVSPPPQVPRPGPRRDGGVDPGGSGTVAARPGRPRSPSGGRPTPGRPGGAESPGGVPSTLEPPPRPAPAPQPDVPAPERPSERGPERVAPEAPSPSSPRPPETPAGQDAELVDLTTTIFQPYIGANLGIADAQPHPGALVETSAMASVAGPSITVQHHLAPKVITEGRLSIAQLDPVLRARQAHDRLLHNGKRQGFFDGDGTGTGKGRIIAGIIFDNWQEGRTKALWVSKSQDNFAQAQGDWVDVSGRDKHDMFTVHRPNIPHAQPITRESGVLFMPYDTLKGHAKHTPADTRLKQVVEWLGPEFDGVIALDESHLLGNNMADPNEIFGTKVSQRAAAGQQLQDLLPNARVVYLSATGATEVANLGYLDRLGMWGPGTAFATKGEFVNKVASRGIAAMEYVARDLKAMGLYAARSLSFADVRYERLEVELSPAQMASYDRIAAAWREVTKNIEEALTTTGGKGSMQERNAMNLFWSTQQRFFNQLITSLKTPAVIADMDTYINDPNGGAAIIQLTNTNESTQKRRLAQLQEDEDLEDLTLSPMDILMDYIQTSFPVGAQTPKLQDDGTVVMVPLTDSEGRPVESPEAVAIRDKMIDEMAQLQADIPDGPLEQIIDHFGVDQVAEITGRKQRLIYKEDASGKMVRTRETGRTDRHIAQDLSDFRDDKKRILVFSGKGDTGMDYHAGLKFKNQRQRYHYPLQPGWRADMTVQGLGRSHRTNQASAPIYRLPSTNLPAEKRFISSIARRLDQLGALTRGQRQASAQGLFSERDNLETAYAEDALYRLLRDIQVGRNVSIGPTEFLEATGLDVTTQKGLDATIPRFLNRLFMFPFAVQNSVFNDFSARLDDVIEAAIQSGTYETGVETIRADRVTKMREEVIATHEGTGAETSYIELKVENKPRPTAWDKLQARIQTLLHTERGSSLKGYAQNNRSKRVYAIMDTLPDVDKKTGNLIPRLRLIGILNEGKELAADLTKEKYTLVPEDQAQQLWTQNITALPEYLSHTEHLITGLLMPHWDKLENIATKVQQVFTNDGDRLLGLVVPPSQLKAVMQNFGVTLGEDAPALPSYSPEAAIDRVLTNGSTFRVSNGWHLAPSRIGGQSRVELKHVTSAQARNLEADGVVYERVGYTAHYFLPTGPRGQDVYRRVMVGKQLAQEFAKGEKVDD
jgi:Predicted RNA methylase